jgi:phage tail sheath protein FI
VQRQKQLYIDPNTNQPSEKYANFGRNIYAYLRNLYQGINSSYSISYANWIKSYDSNTDAFTWFGPSAYQAALYARNDFNQFPWTSPLGVNNGQLANIADLAINPNQRERDLLARLGVNPIVRFPEGNLNWNSTTLLKESSALKEISVRRGALWLAKSIQGNLVRFIGEPNTITTRTRINNTLKPILDFMKDNSGLYDYMIICDERNNTAASIDQGVLNVAVYIKPTRPVKFILVDLVITGTGVNFNELI